MTRSLLLRVSFVESSQKELFALVHWNRLTGVYPGLAFRVREHFGSAVAACHASAAALSSIQGFPKKIGERVRARAEILETEREIAAAQRNGIELLGIHDAEYPQALRGIEMPPPLLYLCGRREFLAQGRDRIAIVGSRSPTAYGKAQAERFASALAGAGKTIVSGLARGIDEAAHRSCLAINGDTIAVLGSGLLNVYPCNDARFVQTMRERGLLVSEFPLHAGPLKHHFPWRNRILSGLSRAVLVVEAAKMSGSLLTAHWAIDQGREVWAIPGRIDNPMSSGCHSLLREGVLLALDASDLAGNKGEGGKTEEGRKDLPPLLQTLGNGMKTLDEICAATSRPPESLLPELLQWEVAGLVVRGPGGLYRINSSPCR